MIKTKDDAKNAPDGTHRVDRGLYLRKANGTGSYFVRCQVDGVRHDVGIGTMAGLTPKAAISMAEKVRAEIAMGGRPWERKKKPPLFSEYYAGALDRLQEKLRWRGKRAKERRIAIIERYALPKLKNKRVDSIERNDIIAVLKPIWTDMHPTAKLLMMTLKQVFSDAIARGIIDSNPAQWTDGLSCVLPHTAKVHTVKHHTAAPFPVAAELVQKLPHLTTRCSRALLMIILTCRRSGEVRFARWDELDLDAGVWTIPDERMKVSRKEPRRVPLPTQLVAEMRKWPREFDMVFGKTGIRELPIANTLRYHGNGDWTPHGFRSTFTDWAAENDIPMEVAEKCLDHDVGSKVRQAYQRSDLFDKRREALQQYADALFSYKAK